jgi:hypothetical protein
MTTAAFALLVDYKLTPSRFKPGFEKHLSRPSIALVYAAFGIGLAARELTSARPPARRGSRSR